MTINITVTNLTGGVGKTTIAGLLAHYFSKNYSGPIVMIDMDPQTFGRNTRPVMQTIGSLEVENG